MQGMEELFIVLGFVPGTFDPKKTWNPQLTTPSSPQRRISLSPLNLFKKMWPCGI